MIPTSSAVHDDSFASVGAAPAPRASGPRRAAALVAGLLLLAVGGVLSLGMALVAALAMFVAYRVQARRGRVLGPGQGWVVCTAAVTIVLIGVATYGLHAMPANSWDQMQQAFDSASVASAKQPPPAWMQKVAPGAAQRAASRPQPSPKIAKYYLIWAGAMGLGFVAAFYATIGWAASMLVGYGAAGRWPGGTRAVLPGAPALELME